jgi:hypothetical protein
MRGSGGIAEDVTRRTPQAVMSTVELFPLTLASNVFVTPHTMASWLAGCCSRPQHWQRYPPCHRLAPRQAAVSTPSPT